VERLPEEALGRTIPQSLLRRADQVIGWWTGGLPRGGLSSRIVPLAAKPQRARKVPALAGQAAAAYFCLAMI